MSDFSEDAAAQTAAAENRTPTDAELLGAAPLHVAGELPVITVKGRSTSELAAAIVANLPQGGTPVLFNYRNIAYVTLESDPRTGLTTTRDMDAARFITWLESYIRFISRSKDGSTENTSLSEAQARAVLSSDILRARLPLLKEIAHVRLPIWRAESGGKYSFAPAPAGYDPATHIYTQDSVPIPWEKPAYLLPNIHKMFRNILQDFPLDGGACHYTQSPSFSTIIVAMLGQFLRHNIMRFPIIIVNANQPGSGKSFLVRTMLSPFYGEINVTNYVTDEMEFRKTLNSMVQDGSPYCFLDDLKILVSGTVNRFVTSGIIRDRRMGTDKMFTAENRMQFYATGNGLHVETDILRRSLSIDLFIARRATERQIKGVISETSILTEDTRATFLQLMWSMVQHWVSKGCPAAKDAMPGITSFADYAVPVSIAVACGFCSPYAPHPLKLDAGDVRGEAFRTLLLLMANALQPDPTDINQQYSRAPELAKARAEAQAAGNPYPHTGLTRNYTTGDIIEFAEAHHLLETITGGASPDTTRRIIGNLISLQKGSEEYDSYGRLYRIGNKRTNSRALYPLTILTEPDPAHRTPAPYAEDEAEGEEENTL